MSHNLRPGQFSLHGVKEIRIEYDAKYRMIDVKFVSEHELGEQFADVFTLQAWRDSEYGQPRQFPLVTVVNTKGDQENAQATVLPPPSMVEDTLNSNMQAIGRALGYDKDLDYDLKHGE